MSKMPTSPISRRTLCGLAGSALFLSQFPRAVFAAGGPSGLKVDFPQQGELGEVIGNPYDIAPLTAVIKMAAWCSPRLMYASCRKRAALKLPTM